MATKRTYGEGCAAAHALELVGERWALLAVRELLLGPKRFTDLRAGIPHVSPNVLAQRLRELEQAGIVRRAKLPPPAASRVYELTEWGHELEGVVIALGRWAARSPFLPHAGMSVDSQVLALKAMFDPVVAGDLDARFELRLGEDVFHLEVAGGAISVARGAAGEGADAVVRTDQSALAALVWEGLPLADAIRAGAVTVEGDLAAAKRLLGTFPMPVPAAAGP